MTHSPTFPRTGTFWQAVPLRVAGEEFPGNFEVMITAYDADPPAANAVAWVDATELDGVKGVLITGQTAGAKRIWAHPLGVAVEDPVIDCGLVLIT